MALNLKEFFGQLLFGMALPYLQKVGKAELLKVFQKMNETNPTTYQQMLVGAYMIIDKQLEDYVQSTNTEKDDDLVNDLKWVFEQSARDNGITLVNVDEGQPGD